MRRVHFELTHCHGAPGAGSPEPGAERKSSTSRSMGIIVAVIFSLSVLVFPGAAHADVGSISVTPSSSTQASVAVTLNGYWVSTQLSPDYRVCWKRPGAWQGICQANKVETDATPVLINSLVVGTTYKIHVECYCAKDNKSIFQWRVVATIDYTHAQPPTPPSPPLSSTRMQLRNVSTGQCVYLDGLRVKHSVCGNDPRMTFKVEMYSTVWAFLRNESSFLCIYGERPGDSSVGAAPCGGTGTLFQVIDIGGGDVRLFIQTTKGKGHFDFPGPGGCLYTDSQNGGDVLKQFCTNDVKFKFHLDPL